MRLMPEPVTRLPDASSKTEVDPDVDIHDNSDAARLGDCDHNLSSLILYTLDTLAGWPLCSVK